MLRDARSIPDGDVLRCDLCIVGGGAAGITLASAFTGRRESVVLLESGGLDFDPRTQSLYDGEARGTVFAASDRYLTRSRLRYFGGATNHWEGMCRPLDPEDFEEREWVPHSGWPFGAATVAPYYERAAALCQLQGFSLDPPGDPKLLGRRVPGLRPVVFHRSPPTRFGAVYREELVGSSNVTVALHANAVELETSPSANRVEAVRGRTFEGNAFSVAARRYVLACGGVENPRLLLASNRVERGGLGNAHDLVGRFFMDHPHLTAGALCYVPPGAELTLDELLGRSDGTDGSLGLEASSRRELRLLNCAVAPGTITRRRNVDPVMREVATLVASVDGVDERRSRDAPNALYANLLVRAEQAPNRDSRVSLDDAVDPFGAPRARLDWRLSPDDRASIRRSLETIAGCLGASGGGRIRVEPVLDASWPRTYGGSHHMGTTRMHRDPRHGVVDAHGRVHTVSNLYVAGSSVFPTCGFANPTLTIVALALRLADHLAALPETP